MRIAWLLCSLLLGCATAPPPEPAALAASPAEAPAEAAPSFGGTYTLNSASGVAEECGGKLFLAAKHITVDQSAGTVYADVVDRTYRARFENQTMIADGRFDVGGTCPGTKVYEKWTLTRDGAGRLSGQLESHWSLPPYCQRACEVRFPIVATAE